MTVLSMIKLLRPKPSKWIGEPVKWLEVKYDGVRVLIHKDMDGGIKAYGKKWYIDLWPKLEHRDDLRRAVRALPLDSVVEGEAHNGESNTEMATILASGGEFEFRAFALPALAGKLVFDTDIEVVHQQLKAFGFLVPEIVPIKNRLTRDGLLAIIEERKIEGFLLKISHYRTWFKLKPFFELDGIVTGIKPGTSQHEGKVGSLEVSVWFHHELVPIANVGSLSLEERDMVTALGAKVLGRVVEIKHEGMQKDRCKFPRFARWREDKHSSDCTSDQLNRAGYGE